MPSASFDCTKAQGVDEKIICSDPLLRGADASLHSAYISARAVSRDPAHKASLKSDEHSWILRRNSECGITRYTVVTSSNRPAYVDCMLDEYDERIADLHQMSLHPGIDPAAISLPIRRSFLAGAAQGQFPSDISLATFQIPGGHLITALAWRSDGTLVILGTTASGDGVLYGWRNGSVTALARGRDCL